MLDFIGIIPGFESACCCPPDTPLISKLEKIEVEVFPTFQANLHLRGYFARGKALLGLLWAMIRFRPDVVHVNQAGASRIALFACRLFRVACVVHVRLKEDVEYLARLRPSPRRLRTLIAVSRPLQTLIAAQPELNAISCRMLLDAYRPEGEGIAQTANANKSWDLVCVGRFCESKGQKLLIQAVHSMKNGKKPLRVAFVGEVNEYGKALKDMVDELKVGTVFEFLGHSDNVGTILKQSRWLICPSDYETLGRVLFEAWDHGIPVIAGSQSGGAAASVNASGGGILFSNWNSESLSAILAAATAYNDTERAQMAAAGRNWMLQATNPDVYAVEVASVLQEAMGLNRNSS